MSDHTDGLSNAAAGAAARVDVDFTELARLAVEVAEKAGAHIRRHTPERVEVAATKSTPTDVVTAMDRDVETLIKGWVQQSRPDDGFFGEESGDHSRGELTWIVDPIDGTVNYLYGIDQYAVSVAVGSRSSDESGWTMLAGAVHHVRAEKTWWAAKGHGAWQDNTRLRIGPPPGLSMSLVGTGFGYDPVRRAHQARVLVEVLPQIRDIRRIGSAALDLCRVAQGQLDALYEQGLGLWDYAAGGLIVEEAGGVVRGLANGAPSPIMVIAGASGTVTALDEILIDAQAGEIPDASPS